MSKKKTVEIKPGAYEDAILGFRNHWYPGFRSDEVSEGEFKTLVLLGENLLVKRIDGQVYAVQDACMHRGYKFSEKIECYTKNSITCPVHAFTYNLKNGELITIPGDPESNLIGKANLHSYPIQEVKGMIFIFVGDMNPPAPLVEDVPPGFLDDDLYIVPAVNVKCDCNWRIAADSGFDPNHIFMHKDNEMLDFLKFPFPIAAKIKGKDPFEEIEIIENEGGPKGLVDDLNETIPVYEHTFECDGEVGIMKSMLPPDPEGMAEQGYRSITGSLWMPGCLNVDPFPVPGMSHYEWWVPVDETTHRYMISYAKRTSDPLEMLQFKQEVETVWYHQGYEKFNWYDTLLNNGMQETYEDPDYLYGQRETLSKTDGYTLSWRRLASKHNRGIQTRYGKNKT